MGRHLLDRKGWQVCRIRRIELYSYAYSIIKVSSEKIVGGFGLGQFAK